MCVSTIPHFRHGGRVIALEEASIADGGMVLFFFSRKRFQPWLPHEMRRQAPYRPVLESLTPYVANITDSLKRPNATREWGRVDFRDRRQRSDFGAGLATTYFSPSFGLCFLDLTSCHKRSELMLYGNRRRKTEFSSKPKRVHLRLLCRRF
jgi:hypothetical protein